jgi:hypothetical protein
LDVNPVAGSNRELVVGDQPANHDHNNQLHLKQRLERFYK